jgi:prepilin-type N-terminal cleavage/methylation domain-containing protein
MNVMAMKTIAPNYSTPARRGFTLVELLVVMAIIGVLSGFGIAAMGVVTKKKYINTAQSEMALIAAALERYKSVYGTYPPSNCINVTNILVNPLYYELQGTTNNGTFYIALDGMHAISSTTVFLPNTVHSHFGVDGFINCSHGSGDDAVLAKVFLPSLKENQVATVTNPASSTEGVGVLISSVGGPDLAYQPFHAPHLNPWRYNSATPTNNPGSYDLYIQLVIGGKTNLICNWSKQVQINSPLP